MRRRSPSPVVTGNVSRARMRFESGGSIKNNKTSPSPVPSGFEPLTPSHQHQTLPRTFRFMNNNYNNSGLDTKTTVNRFLSSGNGYLNNISNNNNNIHSSPTPWKQPGTASTAESPILTPRHRRLEMSTVESAAKFLTETLPNNNMTGSCKITSRIEDFFLKKITIYYFCKL